MSEFVVYGVPGSPFLRSVEMGFHEKGQAYRLHAMGPGDSRSEEHLRRHAFGRIPVLEHGDFRLYETQAILRYLDDLFPEPAFEPTDPRAAARMNQLVGVNDWYLFPQVSVALVFQRIVGPALMGLTPDEAVIAAAMPKAKVCIAEIDRLLGDGPFMAGKQLSIADLILAPQLAYIGMTPEGRELMMDTALERWLARMNERPSMQATLPPEPLRRAA